MIRSALAPYGAVLIGINVRYVTRSGGWYNKRSLCNEVWRTRTIIGLHMLDLVRFYGRKKAEVDNTCTFLEEKKKKRKFFSNQKLSTNVICQKHFIAETKNDE